MVSHDNISNQSLYYPTNAQRKIRRVIKTY